MDVRMPELDGIAATRLILEEQPQTRVIVLTTFGLDEYVFGALQASASGFLLKDAEPDHLIASIKLVVTGDSLIAPVTTRRLVKVHARLGVADAEQARDLERLTDREREVFQQLANGRSNAEIAAELFLAEATIKSHVASLLAKLGVRDRVRAVIRAHESGFVHVGND